MASLALPKLRGHVSATADVLSPTGGPKALPPLVARITSDAEVAVDTTNTWCAYLVDKSGTRQAGGALHASQIGQIRLALGQAEEFDITIPKQTAGASLVDLSDPLPKLEVQVFRGAELVAWGPVVTDDHPSDAQTVTVTVKGAFELLNRRRFGDASHLNSLTNPLFSSGFDGWTQLRTQVIGGTPGYQAVGGRITLTAAPPKRLPARNRYVKFNSVNSTDETAAGMVVGSDTLQLVQDIQISAPQNRDVEVAVVARWYIPSDTWFEKKVDSSAITVARLPLWCSPPFGYFSDSEEVYRADWPDPLPRDRWFPTVGTIKVPAGQTKLVHAAFVGPGGVAYMTMPKMVPDAGLDFYQTDVADLVAGVVTHAQDTAYGKTNANITATPMASTGAKIDRAFLFADHQSCGDAITQLASDGYGDWIMNYTPTGRRLSWAYPRRGGYRPRCRIVFNSKAQTVRSIRRTRNWNNGATTTIVQGNGGFYRAEESASLAGSTVTFEEVVVAPDTVEEWGLATVAQERSAVNSQPNTLEVVTFPNDRRVTGQFNLGDWTDVAVVLPELTEDGLWRLMAKTVDPLTDAATLTLVPLTDVVKT